MSITVTPKLRKQINIASALSDLEPGQWCALIIAEAARRRVAKLYPDGV